MNNGLWLHSVIYHLERLSPALHEWLPNTLIQRHYSVGNDWWRALYLTETPTQTTIMTILMGGEERSVAAGILPSHSLFFNGSKIMIRNNRIVIIPQQTQYNTNGMIEYVSHGGRSTRMDDQGGTGGRKMAQRCLDTKQGNITKYVHSVMYLRIHLYRTEYSVLYHTTSTDDSLLSAHCHDSSSSHERGQGGWFRSDSRGIATVSQPSLSTGHTGQRRNESTWGWAIGTH